MTLQEALKQDPALAPCPPKILVRQVLVPAGAIYDPSQPGTLVDSSIVVRFLKDRGWEWGGDWTSLKDYQHFEKPSAPTENN